MMFVLNVSVFRTIGKHMQQIVNERNRGTTYDDKEDISDFIIPIDTL
jgi:hypothetical protein